MHKSPREIPQRQRRPQPRSDIILYYIYFFNRYYECIKAFFSHPSNYNPTCLLFIFHFLTLISPLTRDALLLFSPRQLPASWGCRQWTRGGSGYIISSRRPGTGEHNHHAAETTSTTATTVNTTDTQLCMISHCHPWRPAKYI